MEQHKIELDSLNMKIKNQANILKKKENTSKKNEAQIYTLQETMEYLKLLNQTLMVQIVQLTKEKQKLNLTADFSPFQIVKLIEIASQTDKIKQMKDLVQQAKIQTKKNETIINQPAIDINTILKLNKEELENFIKQQIILLEDKNEKLGLGLDLTKVQEAFKNNSQKAVRNFPHEGFDLWINEGRSPKLPDDDNEIDINEILIGKKKVLQIANEKSECNKAGMIMQSILNGLNKTERNNFNLDEKLSNFNKLSGVNLTENSPRSRNDKQTSINLVNKSKNFEIQMKQIEKEKARQCDKGTEPDKNILNIQEIINQAVMATSMKEQLCETKKSIEDLKGKILFQEQKLNEYLSLKKEFLDQEEARTKDQSAISYLKEQIEIFERKNSRKKKINLQLKQQLLSIQQELNYRLQLLIIECLKFKARLWSNSKVHLQQ